MERLKAWHERAIKLKRPQPRNVASRSPVEGVQKTGFMNLPAEIRDEIYLFCFQDNPIIHFCQPQPIESRIRKLITPRSNKPPTTTKHSLLLVNSIISEGYKNVADKVATPVFHMRTFLDDQEFMTGKAYWVTRPRMKERLTSCRIHINFSRCLGLDLYHVQQDIKSDFVSFIWEHENLRSVTLSISCSAGCKTNFESPEKAFNTIRDSIVIPLLQHRRLETLWVRNGTAVQQHTRAQDRFGWTVKEWHCPLHFKDYASEEECERKTERKTWYCEDLHHLKEAPCNDKCEEHLRTLKLGNSTSERPFDLLLSGWLLVECGCHMQERM